MQITTYLFDKRKNSTKTPSGGTTIDVLLKEGCSVLSPVFLLNTSSSQFNYVEWNGRYYWVTEMIWERNNLLRVYCAVDAIASWKSDILNTSAYVNYSTANYDPYLPENRLFSSTRPSVTFTSQSMPSDFNANGIYILGVIGNRGGSVVGAGFTSVYAIEAGEIAELADFFTKAGSGMEEVTAQLGDAWGCLAFCKWVPYAVKGFYLNQIYLGSVATGVFGQLLSTRVRTGQIYVEIPWPSSDFRRYSPHTEFSIYLPFVGVVDLSPSDLAGMESVVVSYAFDMFTGEIVYSIINQQMRIGTWKGNCSIDIPISTYQRNLLGAIDSGVNGALSMVQSVSGTNVGDGSGASLAIGLAQSLGKGMIGAASSAYAVGRNYFTKTASIQGGFSGAAGAALGMEVILMTKFYDTSQSPSAVAAVMGRPCGQVLQMRNLAGGYVQTAEFAMGGNATLQEKAIVSAYMQGGVYIE